MDSIQLKAMGKINLGLDIVGKREDGYHEVRMVMQMVSLFDKITMTKTRDADIRISTNLPFLPVNENNIAYKAAKMLMDEFHLKTGVDIHLEKHIPVAAGMAGGSSNAATVLHGMNRLYRLGLSRRELMERGAKLGADVPYCIARNTSLCEGIGEILTPLKPMPDCYVLIAKPGYSVSTKFVYQNLKLDAIKERPDIDGIVECINAGDLKGMSSKLVNVLETVTVNKYPGIEMIKDVMKEKGALNAIMSGSGPTVFGIFEHRKEAKEAYDVLKKGTLAKQVFITRPFKQR